MSTINSKNVQVGTSGTATDNFTLYQPATPDGTVRLGVGNSGATTADVVTVNSSGVTVTGSMTATTLSGAVTGTTGSFSGNLSFNSGYGSAAVAYGCRAWVNFNGTGTPAIRASANVTSLTDNGTGDYTVNLTTAMPDANYAVVTGGKQDDTYNDRFFSTKVVNTSSFRMYFAAYSIGLYDPTYAHAAIFR